MNDGIAIKDSFLQFVMMLCTYIRRQAEWTQALYMILRSSWFSRILHFLSLACDRSRVTRAALCVMEKMSLFHVTQARLFDMQRLRPPVVKGNLWAHGEVIILMLDDNSLHGVVMWSGLHCKMVQCTMLHGVLRYLTVFYPVSSWQSCKNSKPIRLVTFL